MPKYVYTIHAKNKLKLPEIKKLGINKKIIQKTIEKPTTIDRSEEPVLIAIGNLTKTLSLNVVYKQSFSLNTKVETGTRIITFWPSEKGRYERKVLSRR